MIFFSQCGEDKFLLENYFKNKKNGVFIELGALDGILYSNTKLFEDHLDWSGILIEPHPLKYENLKINRPNCVLFNNLVSNSKEELNFKYFLDGYSPVSGVEKTLSKHHFDTYYNDESKNNYPQSEMLIKPRSLTDIIKSTNLTHIDFMSLDVEGHEYEVLLSYDYTIQIDVILIEMLGVDLERDELCRNILIKNGYRYDNKISHNEIYIHKNYKK